MKDRINFFVIGAQKSGTTAIHNLLRQHPEVCLPINKEAPFFSKNEYFEKGMDWYLREFYDHRIDGHIKGSVTPQYMAYPEVPERLFSHCPDAKLIAILRDPIARIRSHYRMRVRAYGETRTLQSIIDTLIADSQLLHARSVPTPNNAYLCWGEYGRILHNYSKFFSNERMLIIYYDNFLSQPVDIMNNIFDFLEIDRIELSNSKKKYNVNNSNLSFKSIIANLVYNEVIRKISRRFFPKKIRRKVAFWSITNRRALNSDALSDAYIPPEQECLLARLYLEDSKVLKTITGHPAPWQDKYERLAVGCEKP